MASPRFNLAIAILITLNTLGLFGCSPQRVPTSPAAGAAATMTDVASPTLPATGTPTVVPSSTPTSVPTLLPTPIGGSLATPTTRLSSTRAPIPTSGTIQVKLFFVAIGDNGKSGRKIGCDDSLVAVNRIIPATSAPLTASFKEFLNQRDQFYGQSGLYNALFRSKLQVAGISITNAKATINLTGTLTLGGVCDNPRVAAQLEALALQFTTVKEVAITINGVPLEKLLSEKG